MPTPDRTYSPDAADRLRRALLGLAAATAIATTAGCDFFRTPGRMPAEKGGDGVVDPDFLDGDLIPQPQECQTNAVPAGGTAVQTEEIITPGKPPAPPPSDRLLGVFMATPIEDKSATADR